MHYLCPKCKKLFTLLLLILGVLFLLRDLGVWNFWGIQWWTALLLLFSLTGMCSMHCPECQACCTTPAKKKK